MTVSPGVGDALNGAEIAVGLRRLGLGPGCGVVVHSSLRSLGYVVGGAITVIRALQEVVTSAGTLLMPSFNHGVPFEPGGPGYYDPLSTPTTNGIIPDTFWRMSDVRRSLDPTHAVAAWGAQAEQYTRLHHRTLTMGPASPLGLLCADGGYALLLGVGYGSNTFHHVVEMSTNAPCLGQRTEAYAVHLPDGRQVLGRTWGWREGFCPINDHAVYGIEMASLGLERVAMIGPCRATLYRLQDGYNVIARMLAEGVGSCPPCHACPIRPRTIAHTVASDWNPEQQCLLPESTAWTY